MQDAVSQANHTKSEHQMWACGTDFQYQNADHWYANLDKLIHYVIRAQRAVRVFLATKHRRRFTELATTALETRRIIDSC